MRRLAGIICVGLVGAGCSSSGGSAGASGDGGGPSSQPPLADGSASAPPSSSTDSGSVPLPGDGASPAPGLVQVTSFGSNPAGLNMYEYVPAGMPANAPLVVVMHGCTQGARDIAQMGWNGVADEAKIYVVYPEQVAANNALLCFNWFGSAAALARGSGENLSIKQMVDKMAADHSIDPRRVFVAGFSAGAAETLLMLADWPDVFAGGAALSGVPYGCASSVTAAQKCMQPGVDQTAAAWGALVRAADPGYAGAYPRVSLWHGASDGTVAPLDLSEEVKQWTDVLGLSATATGNDTVAGFPHATYADAKRSVLVESYEITGMNHAVPIDTAGGCGTSGAYAADVKLCAARAIAGFFGIAAGSDAGK